MSKINTVTLQEKKRKEEEKKKEKKRKKREREFRSDREFSRKGWLHAISNDVATDKPRRS